MKTLATLLLASTMLFSACKKEPTPEEKAKAVMEQAMKSMSDDPATAAALSNAIKSMGSGVPSDDATARATAMAAAAAAMGAAATAKAEDATESAGTATDMAGGAAAMAAMAGALGGGGTLSPENQATVNELNIVLGSMAQMLETHKDDCAALGKGLTSVAAANQGTFKKAEALKNDKSQMMAIASAMMNGPALKFVMGMGPAAARCQNDPDFKDALSKMPSM